MNDQPVPSGVDSQFAAWKQNVEERIRALETAPRAPHTSIADEDGNEVVRLSSDGLTIFDEMGDIRAKLGTISDGYGLELLANDGTIVTQAMVSETYNSPSERVNTPESTTSANYVDLATAGPSITVDVSGSGRLLIIVRAWMWLSGANEAAVAFALSGANTAAASNANSFRVLAPAALQVSSAVPTLLTGLNPGPTTITAKYRSDGVGTAVFADRVVFAVPF